MSYGVRYYDLDGVQYSGDAGPVNDDGTWAGPITPASKADFPPGEYKVSAHCSSGRDLYFNYPDKYFTRTG